MPGTQVQYQMAPVGRRVQELHMQANIRYRPSAVLIVLCRDAHGELFIPLIERHAYKGVHSGQVSLPGGKYEEQDINLENTALRECREEIGLSGLELLGGLTELLIPVSGFKVQPFVAHCRQINPTLVGQEREVKSLLNLYLNDLLNDSIQKVGPVSLPDNSQIRAPYFELNNYKIWGATAMILRELKEVTKLIAS